MSTNSDVIPITKTEMANWKKVAWADAQKEAVAKARQGCKQGEAYKNNESKLARKEGALLYCPETGEYMMGHVKYSVIVEAKKVDSAELLPESED